MPAWGLTSKFEERVRQGKLEEDGYVVLSKIWDDAPEITAEMIVSKDEGGGAANSGGKEGKDGNKRGLSKTSLFVGGVCLVASLTIVAGVYVGWSRTSHKTHKREKEIEDLEAELDADAAITGMQEKVRTNSPQSPLHVPSPH